MSPYEISLARYQTGVKVKIIHQRKYKAEDLIGKTGIIQTAYGTQIKVKVNGMYNLRSAGGYFYFTPSELEIIDEEFDNIMEENNMHNITNYLNIAKVKFVDGNNACTYDYANFEGSLKAGDLCVVKTAHHGFGLARVVEIIDRNDIETCREIVSIVNTEAYDGRVETRARSAELKAKMEERAKQLQDIALYQMLAKDDPAMMELLMEYQELPKV